MPPPIKVPIRYLPKTLSNKDKNAQSRNLKKSRKMYKAHKYINRPQLKSFHSRKSSHLQHAYDLYNVDSMQVNDKLAKNTGCTRNALDRIIDKGRGAYYSSGSRPNQTADSWAYARLASSLTGGPSSAVDYHILKDGCNPNSKPLRLARKTYKIHRRKFKHNKLVKIQ
jgi:hypothetical protein